MRSCASTYASTMAKCGMVMPRKVAISSPSAVGNLLLRSKDLLICNRFPTDSRRMFFPQILRRHHPRSAPLALSVIPACPTSSSSRDAPPNRHPGMPHLIVFPACPTSSSSRYAIEPGSRSGSVPWLLSVVPECYYDGEVRHEDAARSGDFIAGKLLGSSC